LQACGRNRRSDVGEPAVRDREAAERRAAAIRKYTPEMLRKKFPS
jgi:hypothetical protein